MLLDKQLHSEEALRPTFGSIHVPNTSVQQISMFSTHTADTHVQGMQMKWETLQKAVSICDLSSWPEV